MLTNEQAKSELIDWLKHNVVSVTFTKRDGTERKMKCTLLESYLPKQVDLEEHITRKKGDSNLVVWDVELNAWRSFRFDTVKEYSTLAWPQGSFEE